MGITNKDIFELLRRRGIDCGSLGYKYMHLCLRAMLDGQVDSSKMMNCYKYVAEKINVSPQYVTLNIRRALNSSTNPQQTKQFLLSAYYELLLEKDENAPIFD